MLRTKSGLPKHCGWNLDQHGKRRVRFRKGGFSTYLTGTPWSDDFMRQYAAALDGVKARRAIGAERMPPRHTRRSDQGLPRSGLKLSVQDPRCRDATDAAKHP